LTALGGEAYRRLQPEGHMAHRGQVRRRGRIPVIILKEGRMFVAFSPALDLATCGRTYDEAYRNLREAVELFFEECLARGTLDAALESCGWRKTKTRPPQWVAPTIVGHDLIAVDIPQAA
jgi:predicted RNase H-like HicB family nuclease